ncbi:uncharacterized protein BDZ99DRAFT_458520 [Mytilinidion resinicola]|uniref:F-box domain-containing protein n=1 Tax=Mytilinidion resinicola TaxID=574789 RepID=A0A6A6Z783_9PEZI|nr:uncharacterized protein BDZ99DRAFT_458520 [Mytilinidion resinicola]KAF2816678.1 hypothetical protein BDZ99DRAFT_458520 [Mytilinidion resinicola]
MEPYKETGDRVVTEIIPTKTQTGRNQVSNLPLDKSAPVIAYSPGEPCYLLAQAIIRRQMKTEEDYVKIEECTSSQIGRPSDNSSREESVSEKSRHLDVDAKEEAMQHQNAGYVAKRNPSMWSIISCELHKRISSLCFSDPDSKPKPDLQPSLLLRLPTELRLEIWRFVFPPPHSKPHRALSLLRTNRQIYEEALTIAFPRIRFYFRDINALKGHLASLSLKQLTQLNHLRLPARSLEAALKDLALIPFLANLDHTTVTITLHLPSAASNRLRTVPSPIALQEWLVRAEKLWGLRSITIDNNGFYSDWQFLLLFLHMHALHPRTPIHGLFTNKHKSWAYSLRRKEKREGGGFVMVMHRMDVSEGEWT